MSNFIVDFLNKPNINSSFLLHNRKYIDKKSMEMMNTLLNINKMKNIKMAIECGSVVNDESGLDYHKYLTPNNPKIRELVRSIINFSDSSDQRMFKIEQWVNQNIKYKTDVENYGVMERWAYPIETINRGFADCEDQAFLVHTLGLAANVDPKRLRTYGGLVFDPNSSAPGGHGWPTYIRESDNKRITLDTAYYCVHTPIDERMPLSEDLRYIDDFWYIEAGKTVSTPYANKVRYCKGSILNIQI